MQKNNIYSNATIVRNSEENELFQDIKAYELNAFIKKADSKAIQNTEEKTLTPAPAVEIIKKSDNSEILLNELKLLKTQLENMETKITDIQSKGVSQKDLDKQVVEAIKDLKNYSAFFEQATFQLESKILKTSMAIAKKIISIEVGENSSLIAKETIRNLLTKVKTASKIQIHLNPKDYIMLKGQLKLNSLIELHEDVNVALGGVVIASDLGNFDGNIEAKVNSMLESLDNVM